MRFYFDVVCPYAYLGATEVEALADRIGQAVTWCPVLLGGLFRELGGPDDPNVQQSAARARVAADDRARSAAAAGISVTMPPHHPGRTVDAMRLLTICDDAVRPALARALFRAYWHDGVDLAAAGALDDIARAHGVDPAAIGGEPARQALRRNTAEAARRGVFGVPTFELDDGRLFWGHDRIGLVERAAGGTPQPAWGPGDRAAPGTAVQLFHDFSSPFSYLAQTQVRRWATDVGATVTWSPILLGALFRDIGTADVPLLTMHAKKQAYVRRDMLDWAAHWGVPLRFPSHFPIRTVLPLRVAIAKPEATAVIYRAAWAEDRRIDEPAALRAVLDGAGFDGAALCEQATDPAIKAALRDNTAAAQAAGACGVPTFVVRRPDREPVVIWGQDRFASLTAVVCGP